MGEVLSVLAAGLVTSFAPMITTTSVWANSGLISSISMRRSYGMSASASSTFMWPGIRPATGWMANLTSTPDFVSESYNSRTLCWAWATAMPYPGTTTTEEAASRMEAASSAEALR